MLDPEYLRLYRQYVRSIKAYEIMLKKRRDSRAQWLEARQTPRSPRRPVGSPAGYTIPPPSKTASVPPPKQPPMRIYMGEILGWAKLIGTSPPRADLKDPAADFDAGKFFDNVQLQLYWNVKIHYEKCKKEFFDYVRRKSQGKVIRKPSDAYKDNLRRARRHLDYAGDLQLLGVDEAASEAAFRRARIEVETACYKVWENYQNNPESIAMRSQLILILIDAQLVGNYDSPIVGKMQEEIGRLMDSEGLK